MQEIIGNIWDFRDGSTVIAVTTNGAVSRRGRGVMGRGVAAQAAALDPDLPVRLGAALLAGGNHVHLLVPDLVSFPVEHSPFEHPDPRLIARSAAELRALADQHNWQRIVVPRPGCGGGGLRWDEVRPLLSKYFDDRFLMISPS